MSKLLRVSLPLYQDAKNYSYYLCQKANLTRDYVDLVHDCFVNYYKSTGKNLFLEPKYLIVGAIKREWMNQLRARKFMYEGKLYSKITKVILEDYDPEQAGFIPRITEHPWDDIDAEFLRKKVSKVLNKDERDIVKKLEQGYIQREIAEVKNISQPVIAFRLKKIRNKVQQVL